VPLAMAPKRKAAAAPAGRKRSIRVNEDVMESVEAADAAGPSERPTDGNGSAPSAPTDRMEAMAEIARRSVTKW
jgi:hypothetical protein